MKYENIIYEKDKGIATLTFNRPHVMNAGNYKMGAEMHEAIAEASKDDEVRVLIITGAGRGFHAGDDVKEIFLGSDQKDRSRDRWVGRAKGAANPELLPVNIYKPTIAAVNGPAIGIGMDIALCCDIRVASENAKFGYFYVRRGVVGVVPGFVMLKELIGLSRAMEMMLSGELMDAAEAQQIGLVRKVVPQDQLMAEAHKMAQKLMQGAPLAQMAIKQCVYKGMFDPYALPPFINQMEMTLWQSEDFIEGAKSFAEKREPHYKGR